MKATVQYFPGVLFTMLSKVASSLYVCEKIQYVLVFKSESYRAVLSCGAVYYTTQGGLAFEIMNDILKCEHSNDRKLLCSASQYVKLFIMLYKVV